MLECFKISKRQITTIHLNLKQNCDNKNEIVIEIKGVSGVFIIFDFRIETIAIKKSKNFSN